MAAKRKDSKGRILRKGEGLRSDGRYMFRYTDLRGENRVEYSWRLVETAPYPKGKQKDLSLREKEALIEQDRHDLIFTSHGNMVLVYKCRQEKLNNLMSLNRIQIRTQKMFQIYTAFTQNE